VGAEILQLGEFWAAVTTRRRTTYYEPRLLSLRQDLWHSRPVLPERPPPKPHLLAMLMRDTFFFFFFSISQMDESASETNELSAIWASHFAVTSSSVVCSDSGTLPTR